MEKEEAGLDEGVVMMNGRNYRMKEDMSGLEEVWFDEIFGWYSSSERSDLRQTYPRIAP